MRKRFWVCGFAAGMALAVWCAAAARAQTASAPNQDLSGIWAKRQAASPPWAPGTNRQFAAEMPLQSWAQEYCKKVGCGRGVNSSGEPGGGSYYVVEDPAFNISRCAPYGFPRLLIGGGLMEIFQVPDRVFMRFQTNNEMREIWTDGRANPENPDPRWSGHSIGRWDGDTLVVDTTGVYGGDRGKTKWLDPAGTPHSEELHVIERIRRTSPNALQMDLRFEDPQAFTAPFSGKVVYELRPNEQISEYIRCENRIFSDDKKEIWPLIFGGEYPKPRHPPAGTTP
ncbi:MAG: hypothetical protein HW398_253 [Acidobacteria bacterium]|nr:hypothetical protein [Acidobacteriota bacterium]